MGGDARRNDRPGALLGVLSAWRGGTGHPADQPATGATAAIHTAARSAVPTASSSQPRSRARADALRVSDTPARRTVVAPAAPTSVGIGAPAPRRLATATATTVA